MVDMNIAIRQVVGVLLTLFLLTGLSFAQVVVPTTKPLIGSADQPETTQADIQEKIEIVKNKANLNEVVKQRILSAYYAAETDLNELYILNQQTEIAKNHRKNLPAEIKQLKKRILETEDQLKSKQGERAFSQLSIVELEQQLGNKNVSLSELRSSVGRLEVQIAERKKFPQQIREQIANIKDEQDNAEKEQAGLRQLIKNNQEFHARHEQLNSRAKKLNATLNKLEIESISYPLNFEAEKLELELSNLQSKQLANQVGHIENHITAWRRQDIEKERAELIRAQKEAADKHPVIQAATQDNIEYHQLLQEATKNLEQYQKRKKTIEARHKQLENDFESAEQKIEWAGLSPSLGNLLREQRRNLPLLKKNQHLIETIQEKIALASLEQFRLDEEKRSFEDLDQVLVSQMSAYVAADIN